MTDYPDEVWNDRLREKHETTYNVCIRVEAVVTVHAYDHTSDEELAELAVEKMTVEDVIHGSEEFVSADVD